MVSFFVKQTVIDKENRRFEKQFSNRKLLLKLKKSTSAEQKRFGLHCLRNCLLSAHLNEEIRDRIYSFYELIYKEQHFNKKSNYLYISPDLLRVDFSKLSLEENPFSLSDKDIKEFYRFFCMIPLEIVHLFENIQKIMLSTDKSLILHEIYKILNYMDLECVKYPLIKCYKYT